MSSSILPEPPHELKQLSLALSEKLRTEIASEGFIPFSRFMEMALYEPGLGYYSAGLHKFGEHGDFVTAPELGSLFAGCLARQAEQVAAQFQSAGEDYDILELGAGTGRLAADLLSQMDASKQPRRYLILERSADLQNVQQHTIAASVPDWQDRVKWLSRPPSSPWQGLLLANEVVDALAVERFRIGQAGIEQCCVGIHNGAFTFRHRPADDALRSAVAGLGQALPTGYQSELNLHLPGWLQAVSGQMQRGIALFIDYGYPRSEFYRPERSDGTLMCHYRHRAHDDVFFWPGLQDITAFVDFTALAEAGESCGLELSGYTSQTMFLLGSGLDQVLTRQARQSDDDGVRVNMEARQLTLPGNMGERFQAMALSRGMQEELSGFSLRDLSHRL